MKNLALNFFYILRKKGFSLHKSDLDALLQAEEAGLAVWSKEHFIETCQILWAKDQNQQVLIKREFEFFYNMMIDQFNRPLEKEKLEPEPEDSNQHIASDNEKEKQKSPKTDNKVNPTPNKSELKDGISTNNQFYDAHNAPVIAFYPSSENDANFRNLDHELYSPDFDYSHSPFIFSEDYHPISLRQMQQTWRNLRENKSSHLSSTIDWNDTIQLVGKQGFFTKPVYKPNLQNQIQLIIIIDHLGSMVAHESLGFLIVDAAQKEGGHPNLKTYYTHNIPKDYLYTNPEHTDFLHVDELLVQCSPRHTALLIYSDAGASRRTINPQRIIETRKFIQRLKKRINSMVWLNPIPKNRWTNTSAKLIQTLVPMFECTEIEVGAAIKTLKIGNNGSI